jgi:predicted acylesterase/phospholipase RssA
MAEDKTKYLAITIAGAVSLGSYESGAVYELLDAIAQHNANPQTKQAGDYVKVDVITGASAGGMTGAILTQRLLFQCADFVGPYDNPLYNTWVVGVDIRNLVDYDSQDVAQGGDSPPDLSLLSSAFIAQVAQKTMKATDNTGLIPVRGGPHAAVDASRGIYLGLALTNVNGLDFAKTLISGGEFVFTDFSDRMLRKLGVADRAPAPWDEIADAAVASGSFPFAFHTRELLRSKAEYSGEQNIQWPGADPFPFDYTDGGALQNQPLGMARKLVAEIEESLQDPETRAYFLVSPNPLKSSRDGSYTEGSTTIGALLIRFISLYMDQAAFQDWLTAEGVNDQIIEFRRRIVQLAHAIRDGKVDEPSLQGMMEAWSEPVVIPGTSGRDPSKSRQQVRRRYQVEIGELGGASDGTVDAFVDIVVALESAARLSDRELMTIYGVICNSGETAGAGIWAFVGFLDQKFRKHDYDLGRTKMQSLLTSRSFQMGPLGPLRFTPREIDPLDGSLTGLKLKNIPRGDVKMLRDGLQRRVREIVEYELASYPVLNEIAAGLVSGLLGSVVDWEFGRDVQGMR